MSSNSSRPGGYVARDRAWHPPALYPQYKTSVKRSPQAARAPASLSATVIVLAGWPAATRPPISARPMLPPPMKA